LHDDRATDGDSANNVDVAKVKYAFLADGCDLWRELAIELADQFAAEPLIWLGHPRHREFAEERFPECEVLDERELNVGNFARVGMAPLPHQVRGSSKFLRFESAAMYSLQRNEIHRSINFLDRRTYISSLSDFLWGRLSRSGVTHLVASQAPHTAAGLLLAGMFEALGIEMLHFDQVTVGPFMVPRLGLSYRDVGLDGLQYTPGARPESADVKHWVGVFRSQVEARRFAPSEEVNAGYESDTVGLSGLARRVRLAFLEMSSALPSVQSPEVAGTPFRSGVKRGVAALSSVSGRSRALRLLRSTYDACATEIRDRQNFALFLLHYEPEKTTVPDGGLNGDQLAAVRTAASSLPSGMKLLVKEHPSQLMYVAHGHTGRRPSFYRELGQIEGVELIDRRTSNWDLIDRASIVFTVTGTVGLEATLVDTPVVYFGFPWYAGLAGTYSLGDSGQARKTVERALGQRAPTGDAAVGHLVELIKETAVPGVISPGDARHFERLGWSRCEHVAGALGVVASYLGVT